MKTKQARMFQIRIRLSDDQIESWVDRMMLIYQHAKLTNSSDSQLRQQLRIQFEEMNFSDAHAAEQGKK